MNFSVRTFVRSAAMLIAIVGSAMSAHAGLLNLAVYNTGSTSKFDEAPTTLVTAGQTDSHYILPAGSAKAGIAQQAISNATASGLSFATNVKSEYVSWQSVGNSYLGLANVPATFIYQTTFSIDPVNAGTTVHFAGSLSSSTSGTVTFLVDGVAVAPTAAVTTAGGNSFKSYDFSTYVATSGSHTLGFQVTQTAGSAKNAFNNFFITATAVVPEPSTFALLGMGVVGMAVAGYRRRRNAV